MHSFSRTLRLAFTRLMRRFFQALGAGGPVGGRGWFVSWSAVILGGVVLVCAAQGQDGVAAMKGGGVKVGFVPPPLEGTFSLGVYDKSGKLLRTLRADADASEFTVALNGFVVGWDGKDDSGKLVSAGKYRLLGVAVGDIDLSGEAYHGNDWMLSDDAPRLVGFRRLQVLNEGSTEVLELFADDLDHAGWRVRYVLGDTGADAVPAFEKGKEPAVGEIGPVSCPGRDGSKWSIEKVLGETVVVQFDAQGEVARRLSIGAGEPVPVAVAASTIRDEIFLLEQDGDRTRLRGLRKRSGDKPSVAGVKTGTSPESVPPVWETFIEKNRWNTGKFDMASKHIGRNKPFVPEKKIRIKTKPNPLIGDVQAEVDLMLGLDAEGSFLRTVDGLRIRRLSSTPHLAWAVFGREARQPAIVLLQGDGAVVEELRIGALQEMMTFDAGEYQWPPK